MATRLYLDECVHDVILTSLRQQGVEVTSVRQQEREGESDEALFRTCAEQGWALVTYDSDYLAIATRWQREAVNSRS